MSRIQNVRGQRRRFAWLRHRYQAAPESLRIAELAAAHYNHEQLGLGPWHWHQRLPPRAVRRQAAQYLLRTWQVWQQQLAQQPEPYYLAVWLVSPDFAHSSQVVVGVQERINWYAAGFGEPVPEGPPLPREYQQLPGAAELTWQTHRWEVMLDPEDYPTTWPAWALRKPHHLYQASDGKQYLMVQTGWVWVGQQAATPSSAA